MLIAQIEKFIITINLPFIGGEKKKEKKNTLAFLFFSLQQNIHSALEIELLFTIYNYIMKFNHKAARIIKIVLDKTFLL